MPTYIHEDHCCRWTRRCFLYGREERRQKLKLAAKHVGNNICNPTACPDAAANKPMTRDRRIKCDERRPACKRCVASQRQCPGYDTSITHAWQAQAAPAPQSPTLMQRIPTLPFAVSSAESATFDYLRLHMAVLGKSSQASWFPSWTSIIVQAGQHIPAVFHTVTAFGALLQLSDGRGPSLGRHAVVLSAAVTDTRRHFALDQYCKRYDSNPKL